MFKYYFSNTCIGLGCSEVSLCSLGVEIEVFPYTMQQWAVLSIRSLCSLSTTIQLQIVLSIRLLCSLSTTVCVVTDSIVYQVTLLSSNNSLCYSEQYCVSGCSALFLHWWFVLL